MAEKRKRSGEAELLALLAAFRLDGLARTRAADDARVPASADRAAERAFRAMEAWIAAGEAPPPVPTDAEVFLASRAASGAAKGAAAAAALKKTALLGVAAALAVGAGAAAALPALRRGAGAPPSLSLSRGRTPSDYAIPDPGGELVLQEEAAGETMSAKRFAGGRRLLMVQIAETLPEEPPDSAFEQALLLSGREARLYDVDGDRQILIRDGGVSILIKMYNASEDEILDYAAALMEANGMGQ